MDTVIHNALSCICAFVSGLLCGRTYVREVQKSRAPDRPDDWIFYGGALYLLTINMIIALGHPSGD